MPLRGNVMLLLGQPSQSTFVRLSGLPYYLFSPTHVLSHPSIWMAIVLLYCRLRVTSKSTHASSVLDHSNQGRDNEAFLMAFNKTLLVAS